MSDEPPKIRSPLKINGSTVGDIVINPDGSFEGRIHDRLTHVLWAAYLVDGFSNSMALHPNVVPAVEAKESSVSGRNVFENNTPEVTPEEALKYGDKLVALLPHLESGEHYEIVNLKAGTGIVKHGRVTRD